MHEPKNTGQQGHPSIQFLGEQDGEPERQLKSALVRQFKTAGNVYRAYLVRVRYGGTTSSVALAIAASGEGQKRIVESVRRVFSAQFTTGQHLDVMFPSSADEAALSTVCRPFFNYAIKLD
jgi:hypothetical protein